MINLFLSLSDSNDILVLKIKNNNNRYTLYYKL